MQGLAGPASLALIPFFSIVFQSMNPFCAFFFIEPATVKKISDSIDSFIDANIRNNRKVDSMALGDLYSCEARAKFMHCCIMGNKMLAIAIWFVFEILKIVS